MDYYLLFTYKLTPTLTLQSLTYKKLTLLQHLYPQTQQKCFQKLQSETNFKKMLISIINQIHQLNINFVNVRLVCQDSRLFREVLPKECKRRNVAMVWGLMNFIDVGDLLRERCKCPFTNIHQMVQFMEICTAKQSQSKTLFELFQLLLKKLSQLKLLTSTQQQFLQRHKDHTHPETIKSKYFKIRGLPFKIFPQEVSFRLASEVATSQKELIFINQNGRFSGRAIIKVPQEYEKKLIQKNRMYIGNRYIQLQNSTSTQFQRIKIQNKQSYQPSYLQSYTQSLQKHSSNDKNLIRYSSNIMNQPNRSRSRDQNHISSEQSCLKIRGLPFSFTQWDVENVFSQYGFVGGSVKLGIKPGTSMKNGQAVLMMRSYRDAEQAMTMTGYKCMGRYLEVRLIDKHEYNRYK